MDRKRLKCVFNVDTETFGRCGEALKVIAYIVDQNVIDRILAHLRKKQQDIPIIALLTPKVFTDISVHCSNNFIRQKINASRLP
jgi:hypothetical protein